MSHPMNHVRQSKVERSRVGHITKGYAKGGAVHGDEAQDRKLFKKMMKSEMHAEGEKSKHRADRPRRAKGGKVKKNAKTIVNVITGHPGNGLPPPPPMAPPGPPMGIAPAAAMPPPRPPMGPQPAVGPGGPPPMPLRAKGGRVTKGTAVFEEGQKAGTPVQHDRGKNDLDQLGRGKPITYAKGGSVSKKGRGDGGDAGLPDRLHFSANEKPSSKGIYAANSDTTRERARGGKVESSDAIAPATKLPGGAGGGLARLAKEHRAERKG